MIHIIQELFGQTLSPILINLMVSFLSVMTKGKLLR
jgi:hypothetical protein